MPLAYALIQEEAGVAGISFPDFPGVVTTGRTAEEAIRRGVRVVIAANDVVPLLGEPPLDAELERLAVEARALVPEAVP